MSYLPEVTDKFSVFGSRVMPVEHSPPQRREPPPPSGGSGSSVSVAPETMAVDPQERKRKRLEGECESTQVENQDFLAEARVLEAALFNMCLDDTQKISRSVMGRIMNKVKDLVSIVATMQIENAKLQGRLCERDEAVKTLSAVRAGPSFAEVAAGGTVLEPRIPSVSRVNKKPEPGPKLVFIRPKSGDKGDSEAAKREVIKALRPVEDKLKIRNIRKTREGGLVVEAGDDRTWGKLLENPDLRRTFEVGRPQKRQPRLMIYDVPRDISEAEGLKAIYEQNMADNSGVSWEEFSKSTKVIFKNGQRDREVVHWVIEVSPAVRANLRKSERIFILWSACRVIDFVAVSRCFNCHRFGHVAKSCREKEQTCGHCAAKGHGHKECKAKNKKAVCPNCKAFNLPSDHEVSSRDCPTYKRAIQVLIERTDYGV